MALQDETLINENQYVAAPSNNDEVLNPNEFILPPNSNGNAVENNIDNATIGQYSPAGSMTPDSDVQFIQNQINPLGGQAPAIAGATNEMFMPGYNQPLQVGSTSGQLTGSRGIYVGGGGYIPFAALERRREAQQKAALKRAEDLGRFKLKKPALSKDPRFNQNLVSTANDFTDIFIKRAEEQYGSREAAMAALTSPSTKIGREFAQQMDNLEILAGEVDQVVDLNAEVEKAIEEGDQYVSDDTLKLHSEFKNLSGKFTGGDAFGAASFRDKLNELQTSQSVDQYFKDNETLKNIEGEILQTAGATDRGDNYLQTTRYQEDFSKGARAQAKAIKQNASFRNREITEDQIFDRIMALKGKVDKRTATVKNKPKQGDGYNKIEDVPVSRQPKVINVGGNQYKTSISVPVSKATQDKPVKIDGLIVLGDDGKLTTRKGISDFTVVEFSTITGADGITRNVGRGQITTKTKGPTGKDVESVEDVTVDYDNVKGSIGGLSKDAKLSVDAFDNVSSGVKRNKLLVDNSNVRGQFLDAFNQSGLEDVDEFVNELSKEGNDIVLNDEARDIINSEQFLGSAKRIKESAKRKR